MRIVTIVGARPQFIKAAAVSRAIATENQSCATTRSNIEEIIVHTGQHYDYEMSEVFFRSLRIPKPKHNLGVGSASHGRQLAKMIEGLECILQSERPDLVLVFGDTNSTLAGAIVADRLHLPVAHVEAGLRSFNRRMPEESNRVLTDHLSSLLFVPTATAVDNLKREGITSGIYLVGDVMEEIAKQYAGLAEEKSTILEDLRIERKGYSLATVHRAENADDPHRLSGIIEAFLTIVGSEPIVWPMHPRMRNCFADADFRRFAANGIKIIEPTSYLDMLQLQQAANVILTDSGGIQKEATWFQVPCVTLRDETEWIETLVSGWNEVAGTAPEKIIAAFERARRKGNPSKPSEEPVRRASPLIVERMLWYVAREREQRPVAV